MKIGIVSYYFYPTITPRAFRAFELAKELARQGHSVTVFVPDVDVDYANDPALKNIEVKKVAPGFYLNKKGRNVAPAAKSTENTAAAEIKKPGISKRIKNKIIEWFYPGAFSFEFSFTCGKVLRKEKIPFDLLISIGLPICSHTAVYIGRLFNKKLCSCAIADYGDPYSFNRSINPPYFHRWFEKMVLNKFNYIMVPTANAVDSYTYFKDKKYIKIIPQGLNFKEIKRASHTENSPVQFVFAGNFYSGIRNPAELFRFLIKYDQPFKFSIYTDVYNKDSMDLITPYAAQLGAKMEINHLLPRLECIYEMSKADFLLNISNTTKEQTPSKLIDYCLSERPIFSYTPGEFDPQVLQAFLKKDYRYDLTPSLSIGAYNIENVVKQILDLAIFKN